MTTLKKLFFFLNGCVCVWFGQWLCRHLTTLLNATESIIRGCRTWQKPQRAQREGESKNSLLTRRQMSKKLFGKGNLLKRNVDLT